MLNDTSKPMLETPALVVIPPTSDCLDHLHFGPGKLGLGLVVSTVQDMAHSGCAVSTILLTRKNSSRDTNRELYEALRKQPKYNLITVHSGHRNARTISAVELLFFDVDHESLASRATHRNPLLITTSVGSGLKQLADPIAKILAARLASVAADAHCIVIACENLPLNSTDLSVDVIYKLRQLNVKPDQISEHVTFADAIVDRICPHDIVQSDGESLEIEVEKHARWIVSNTDRSERKRAILRSVLRPPIELEESPLKFRFLAQEKVWIVNATHVALATQSWDNEILTLQQGLRNMSVREIILDTQDVFCKALASWARSNSIDIPESSLEQIKLAAETLLRRIAEGPEDICRRIIGDWLKHERTQGEWAALLAKIELRVVEPAGRLVADAEISDTISPRQTRAIISLLTSMIRILARAAAEADTNSPATMG